MNIDKLSVEEKVGQLFIASFSDTRPTGEIIHLITAYQIGGLCYLDENTRNPKQVHKLSKNLQLYAASDRPLFLAIHQEGGELNSFIDGMTKSPSQSVLGDVNNRLYTKQMAEIVAEELLATGINMNIAPTLDRSDAASSNRYDESIDAVAKHGVAAIEGYQKKNVSAIAKYFPGDEVEKMELLLAEAYDNPESILYPFFKAIQKGVDAMLVSKSMLPCASTENPALSYRSILHSLVREELGFAGLLAAKIEPSETIEEMSDAAILAILSGIDLLFLPKPYLSQIAVIDTTIEAVKSGLIPESRLDESARKILTLKQNRQIGKLEPFDREKFRRKRSLEFVKKLEERAK